MRILITGGTGCLGTNLTEHFCKTGDAEICLIDNFATSSNRELEKLEGVSLCEGSIADKAFVDQVFSDFRPTHVLHSAAAYKEPDDWRQDIATNIDGSVIIAKASEEHQVKQIINFQTALCYGEPKTLPIPRYHSTAPTTSYGISKTAGEAYLMLSDVPVVSLRLANVCGPYLSIGPIPTFYKRLKAGKPCFCSNAVRDFLDIDDFIRLIEQLLGAGPQVGVFNVSTGEGKSIKDIFDAVATFLGLEIEAPPIVPVGEDDIETVVIDPSDTEAILGWRATTPFETLIEKQLKWYDAHGITSIYSHLSKPGSKE
ncbi:MAG: NAD-dependent epimerase/dehydratase family protein [Opitutales bacterium]